MDPISKSPGRPRDTSSSHKPEPVKVKATCAYVNLSSLAAAAKGKGVAKVRAEVAHVDIKALQG